jgi:TonB family protein
MSKDCVRIRELLNPYADGELGPDDASAVKAHVAACAECRRELAAIEQLTVLARKAGPPEVHDDYWDWQRQQVWRRLREDGRERQRAWRPSVWPRLATLAGALVVVLVVVLVGWQTIGTGLVRSRRVAVAEERVPVPAPEPPAVSKKAAGAVVAGSKLAPPAGEEAHADEVAVPAAVATEKVERAAKDDDAERSVIVTADREAIGRTGRPAPNEPPSTAVAAGGSEAEQSQAAERRVRPKRSEPGEVVRSWIDSVIGQNRPAGRRKGSPSPPVETGRLAAATVKPGGVPELVGRLEVPAVAEKDTGTVLVAIITDTLGRVIKATVARSGGRAEIDSMAVRAARQARFRPAVDSGRRVQSDFKYPVRFRSAKLDSRKDK